MLDRAAITGGLLLATGIASAGVPTCPWDCQSVPDKAVGINDFLAVLAQWGSPGSCDFDGGGVGISDFLDILANWGQCPVPSNDECAGTIIIDRFDAGGTLTEPFDLHGATPSADPSQCVAGPAKDTWYCLRNGTIKPKSVTLSSDVDLLAGVTSGCDCANPGPTLACERLVAAAPTTFAIEPGDEVCIRLLNDLGLPNNVINGNLIITNEPILPTTHNCLDQQPDQSNGLFSDLDCDTCLDSGSPPQQVLAEQWRLLVPELIDELRFWGGYFPGDAGGGEPLPDVFTVKLRLNDDSTGVDLPGPIVSAWEIGQATTRTVTGLSLFGVREFEYTISLQMTQLLQPGLYWVEIYNDTTNDPTDDDWFWEAGTLDAIVGQPGSAFSFDPLDGPPKSWTIDLRTELSLSITCEVEASPHDIELCNVLCPPITQAACCIYQVTQVLSDPVDCDPGGIVIGAAICVTPCTVPGDIAECDPDGSGTVRFQITDNDCLFRATPIDGCTTCPPGTPKWRRTS
ncbi:MAG: hypothetical protein V3S08_04915 [Phycisphaerales bacterium]